jgi:hypothetical protein
MAIMAAAFSAHVNMGAVKSCHFVRDPERERSSGHGFVREGMARLKGLKTFLLNREVEEERKVEKEGGAKDSRWCGWTVGIGSVVFVWSL